MKTYSITFVLFIFLALSLSSVNSQEIKVFPEVLNEVYVDTATKTKNSDDFTTFNTLISSDYKTSFREILNTVSNDRQLIFINNYNTFETSALHYIKGLRKSVNNSQNFSEFLEALKQNFPELSEQIETDDSLRDIYFSTRDQTLNGYLSSLPNVI